MRTIPSELAASVQDHYPRVEENTNIGHRSDHTFLGGVLSAIETIPDELVPSALQTRLASLRGRLRTAIDAWGNRGYGTYFLRGGDILELLAILRDCPDEAVSADDIDLGFVDDPVFRRTLAVDVAAAHRALGHGEWKAATVLAGSVVEALLLYVLRERVDLAVCRARVDELVRAGALRQRPNEDILWWSLSELLVVGHSFNLITDNTNAIADSTREYRNLIHPGREIRENQHCTKGIAHVAVGTMERTIEDLRRQP